MLEVYRERSIQDFFLQPFFLIVTFINSFTIVRVFLAAFFFIPLYLFVSFLAIIPSFLTNAPLLLTSNGRNDLIYLADAYRRYEEVQAKQQLSGTFEFKESKLRRTDVRAVQREASWYPNVEEFLVCGARVRVVHEIATGVPKGQTLVLLHGNPSWSYMWRDIIYFLTEAGYEVYALDFIGHGFSDKPTDATTISFELHMRTLLSLFEAFSIKDFCIIAHDWGGCIATVCGPQLPAQASPRIFLLNSFLPPRPLDVGLNNYSLYVLWFMCVGIFGELIPGNMVMRYMAPIITAETVKGYEAPFAVGGIRSKASVSRFAHTIPGFPDWFLFGIREWQLWRLHEGLCGPEKFTSFNGQARIADRNRFVRQYWRTCSKDNWKATVVYGKDDPLLRDLKFVLDKTIDKGAFVRALGNGWIRHTGHYPTEERPETVTLAICNFLEQTAF